MTTLLKKIAFLGLFCALINLSLAQHYDKQAPFLLEEERVMLDEINSVRTNPKAYVPHIERYIQTINMDADFSAAYKQKESHAARELIAELNRMSPLPALAPHLELYNVAVRHGNDIQRQSILNHVGSDGSQIWDRLENVPSIMGGAENLVAGAHSERESLIVLLVDSGIPNRGHRRNLLNPRWEYAAPHIIGNVGGMPNAWIQLFGDSGDMSTLSARSYGSTNYSKITDKLTNYSSHFNSIGSHRPAPNYQDREDFSARNSYSGNYSSPQAYSYDRNPNYNNNNSARTTPSSNRPNRNRSKPSKPKDYSKDNSEDFGESSLVAFNTPTAKVPRFMSSREMAMIEEINLMRSAPKAYIPFVHQYIDNFKNSGWDAATVREEVNVANELIAELQQLSRLSILKPHEGLHQVAIRHGKDIQKQAMLVHVGSDGSWPWDRVQQATNLTDAGENLVGGGTDVRESLIILLIDSGISNRGHRRNLLNPKWEYAACYEVGDVGPQNDIWVQLFAK